MTSVIATVHSSAYRRDASPASPSWSERYGSACSRRSRSGSHCTRAGAPFNCRCHAAAVGVLVRVVVRQTGVPQRPVEAARSISTASTVSWPALAPQPQRYIIHRNDGLIHVIRSRFHAAGNRPSRAAGRPSAGEYAW